MTNAVVHKINLPETVRRGVMHYGSQSGPSELPDKTRNAIIFTSLSKNIEALLFPDGLPDLQECDHVRRLVLAWLTLDPAEIFQPKSSNDLTSQEVFGIGKWASEFHGGEYRQRPAYREELRWVIFRAQTDYQRTIEAMQAGQELTFADCLERWAQESPFDHENDENIPMQFEHWGIDNFIANYTTDEKVAEIRAHHEELMTPAKAEPVLSVPDDDPLAEYF